MLKMIQSIGIRQEILNYETWHLFDAQFESATQRKNALNVIEDVLRLLSNVKENDEDDDDDEFKDDEKGNNENVNVNDEYDANQELWQFMQYSLKLNIDKYKAFKIEKSRIRMKHIQSLWLELVKRIDGEMTQYNDDCMLCYYPITEKTQITLECGCPPLHYECLKDWIERGFVAKGKRVIHGNLGCYLCKQPMRHKAANHLFEETQKLYDKVQTVLLDQLKAENKENVPDPVALARRLYAVWICYQCEVPYYYGPKACGDEANNARDEQCLCPKCDEERMKRENEELWKKYLQNGQRIIPCPG